MKQSEKKPPRIALAFFRWYCSPDFREEIEGDLTERFSYYLEKYGQNKAKWFFYKEVLLLFHPTIIGNIYQITNKNSITMATQNKGLISPKQKWGKMLSLLTIILGIALLVLMITVEDEPGAIPLLLIIVGTVWFFINRSQIRKVIAVKN